MIKPFYKRVKIFPSENRRETLGQSGQTLIEFILLMLMVIFLSFGYMKIVNGNLAKRWERLVNIVVNDHGSNFSRSTASLD